MAPRTYADGKDAVDRLALRIEALDRNEATTRLQLIDDLLFEVLCWDRSECTAEEAHGGKYTDYTLGSPARRMIVEAKRESVAFELPAGQATGIVPIQTLLSHSDTASAMRQALGYAQERGVPYVVAANGHQLIAFIASRQDGTPPLDGLALVYTSVAEMQSDFRRLWDNLSPAGVSLHTLHQTLRSASIASPPTKLSDRLSMFPRYRIRNRLQTDLQMLAELFIEDLVESDDEHEEEFLRECYTASGALSQYALISKQVLKTRYSALLRSELGVSAENASPGGDVDFGQDVLAAALSRRPIVLLGDVGVGKSMFIRHLRRVEAKDVFGDAITLYVDFVAEPATVNDLSDFVASSVAEQLLVDHEIDIEDARFVSSVYRSDLQRFERSIWGELREVDPSGYERERVRFLADKLRNREMHLRNALGHISKGHRKQIVIFLDNIDQRATEFQEQVYVIAHAMAESWPAAVFVSLRPSTFFHSKRSGSLAAYQPRVFTISPPRIDRVLARRILYVLKRLEDERTLASLGEGVHIDSYQLNNYLRTLLSSFDENAQLVELIDNVSGGNVRKALEFVQAFIGSGNVDTANILDTVQAQGRFTVAVHQFLRAIMLGDYQDYDPDSSPIANVFDILTSDGREHFLVPLLVAEAERLGGQTTEEGYVAAQAVFEYGQDLGFTPLQVSWALSRSVDRELLEVRHETSTSGHVHYRITSTGAYTVRRLTRMFAYLDMVATDVPIVDPAYREKVHDVSTIGQRLSRAEVLRAYLDRQWNGLSDQSPSFDWGEASDELRAEIRAIGQRSGDWP